MLVLLLAFLNAAVFDVASVKRSQTAVGPDANNEIVFAPAGITARNATLRRLAAEAYRLQTQQVLGPGWLDRNEYDIEAKAAAPVPAKDLCEMLGALLTDRFNLKQHRENRQLRVYELVVDKPGPRMQSRSGPGMRFHGDMRQLADLIATQLSISMSDDPTQPGRASGTPVPVLDKTGLSGTFDFSINIRSEPGSDMFTLWQRILRDELGLRLESRRGEVEVLVIDSADPVPTAN